LPPRVLDRLVSLLDLAIEAGLTARGKILLLCTNGAGRADP
jgi:hypothetical protein